MVGCGGIQNLPASKSHFWESFYFLIFDVQRLRAAGQPHRLNLELCNALGSLPESKSHFSEIFYFNC